MYWTSPRFGDTRPEDSQYALISNNASKMLTLMEFLCSCELVPHWVWKHIQSTNLEDLIRQAGSRGMRDTIPVDAEWHVFSGQDFNRIMRNRVFGALSSHTHHELHLGFWRSRNSTDKTAHPFFLVGTQFIWDGQSTNCLMEATSSRVGSVAITSSNHALRLLSTAKMESEYI